MSILSVFYIFYCLVIYLCVVVLDIIIISFYIINNSRIVKFVIDNRFL